MQARSIASRRPASRCFSRRRAAPMARERRFGLPTHPGHFVRRWPISVFRPNSRTGWFEMSKRILAVDDSKTMRDMVTFTLRNAGFQVDEAEDGNAALGKLGTASFDLIITDLNMPNMDGISLIRNVRAGSQHRAVPILILTTESDGTKKADGKAAGATGWLVKPFSPEKLIELVQRVCP